MRFMKKTAVMLMVLTMLFTLIPATFANAETTTSSNQAEAEALHELGLFNGTSTTSFVPSLEQSLNREQGIALLLRLLGLEEDANNMTDTDITNALSQYTDKTKISDWAMKNVAYVVHNEIVIGTSATTLAPLASLSGNAFSTMILRNLGYVVDSDRFMTAATLLENAGAKNVSIYEGNAALTRNDAVFIALNALGAKYKNGKTVVEVLIEKGLFSNERAREVLTPFGIEIPVLPTFKLELTANKATLPADNSSSTIVTFKLLDYKTNDPIDDNAKVKFESSLGEFDNDTVDLQNGVATAMLTSEYVETTQDSIITATIKDGSEEYLNQTATLEIPFVANVQPNQGSTMLYGKSLTADRVILKFDRTVKVSDFTNPDTLKIDTTKCVVKVRKQSTSANTGTKCAVRGLLPVEGDTSSLYVMLNVEKNPLNALRDNSQVWVSFTDKTKEAPVVREKSFNLQEIVRPTVKKVEALSFFSFKVTFSEPVIYNKQLAYSAENASNYKIDGVMLDKVAEWGTTKLKVGTFDILGQSDTRNEVIITLGKNTNNKQIALPEGDHSLKCINVGDWAEPSDRNANDVEPEQDIDFMITTTGDAPIASIEVMSPEQFKLTFDKDVSQTAKKVANNIVLQKYSASTHAWTTVAKGYVPNTYVPKPNKQQILVTKGEATNGVTDNYILECNKDWSAVLQSGYYYTSPMRIKLNGDTVTGITSSLGNAEANLDLTGKMKEFDTTSPTVTDIVKTTGKIEGTSYDVTLSEPCKFNANLNTEGITESLDQASGTGVPIPKVKFINQDNISLVVAGTITKNNKFDNEFTVVMQNNQRLVAGDWKMELLNISDDVGNTLNSAPKIITVKDTTGFRVLWFFADVDKDKVVENNDSTDGDGAFDYIYVKYSNPIAVSGQYAEAFKLSNYTLNGSALPSGTSIDNSIQGFDDGRKDINNQSICDSVTIKLPEGTLTSNNVSLTVKSSVKDAKGVSLNVTTTHATPYTDDTVVGNDVMKTYFGHLGFLKGGNTTTKATNDYTLFTTPQKKSILTIGETTIGFNTTGNPMANCDIIINTTNKTVAQICNKIKVGIVGVAPTDVTVTKTTNTIKVKAIDTGIAGNSILVSLK